MINTLEIKNFTAFNGANLQFAALNVIVGENGTGKTHLLKLVYSSLVACNREPRESVADHPTKAHLQHTLASKLMGVFKPDSLGRLVRRNKNGRQKAEVQCRFNVLRLSYSISSSSKTEVAVDRTPSAWIDTKPVYLPTRELLTIYPGFVSLYETTHLRFDETWRDTCILLGAPLAKGTREKRMRELLAPLEKAMGGNVELDDSGGFYLSHEGIRMEMHLVAEGLRKLAMIARLIATGSLIDSGCLFWDEPEANLNPKIQKLIAKTILHLCQSGIQVFIASHSLFLLRELDILLKNDEFKDVGGKFFGLHKSENGVDVEQGATVDEIGDIDSLQEELSQADRYLVQEPLS